MLFCNVVGNSGLITATETAGEQQYQILKRIVHILLTTVNEDMLHLMVC